MAVQDGTRPDGVSDRVLTLPNALSAVRLLLVPVFFWLILERRDGLAIVVQGLFLLWLDTRHIKRFHGALAHPDRSEPVTSPAP